MIYEELKLRPASGSIDRDAITAWLETKAYAFLDPIEGKVWHLSATRKGMERNRHARIANPAEMPSGVFVRVFPDHVSVNAYWADRDEDGRALTFIRWLVREGEWTVQRDSSPFEPLGDPAWLFPEATVELPETDHTRDEVTEGVRYTWEAVGRSFIVHSSGQWRSDDARGELSRSAINEWRAAVESAGELIEYANPDTATANFDIDDESGLERAWFDAGDVPEPLRPTAALVERWGKRSRWTAEDLELWMLAKMRGPRVEAALVQLGRARDDLRRTADALGAVFDGPGHTAAEYTRILGVPRATRPMTVSGTFSGSSRHEYVLPLWPDVVFVVNEHPDGYAWGFGFEGGPASLPAELTSVEPWRWTAERLRREATATEILEEWSFDLDANLTFANGARFLARFDLGLLQTWEPAENGAS